MALPGNLTPITVNIDLTNVGGIGDGGTVSFAPPMDILDAGAGQILSRTPYVATLVGGIASIVLPVTDDTDMNPYNWGYTITIALSGLPYTYSYTGVQIPSSYGASVNLAQLLPPGVPTPPTPNTYGVLAQPNEWAAANTFDGNVTVKGTLLARSATGWINVTAAPYNADNTGATDCITAVNNALAALPVGGVAYFPPGTYLISAPITPAVAGTKILGNKASVAYSAGGANQTVIEAKTGFTGTAMLVASGLSDLEIEDITLHGPNLTGTQAGIQFTGAASTNSAKLRSVLVARTAGDGILADNSVKWISMYDVGVYHAGVTSSAGSGFNLGGGIADSWFDNCLAAGCYTAGWNISGGDNCTWTACRAEDSPAGYGFYVNNHNNYFGGVVFNGCSTDLNFADGFRIDTIAGNGVIQLNGCNFRRDGNANAAGSSTYAGIAINAASMPVVIDGTTVTARRGDSGGADAPHWGINVATSTYVSVNGGYLSFESTGAATHWDSAGRFVLGPNVLTASVSANTPTLNYNDPWSTSDGSRFSQSTSSDSTILAQTNTAGASTNAMLLQTHSIAAGRGLAMQVSGDTSTRYLVTMDGTTTIGPGNATRDTTHGRAAAGVWYTSKNALIGAATALGDNGVGEIQLANATTVPTTNPAGGASLYATGGQPAYRNPQGLVGRVEAGQLGATSSTTVTASTVGTTETALCPVFTIPAADAVAGATYRIVAWGYITTSGAPPTITLQARLGGVAGTSIAATGALTPTASLTNAGFWKIECVVTCRTTGVSGAWSGVLSLLDAFSTTLLAADNVNAPTPTVTRDTTASSDLLFTVTYSANTAGNSIVCSGSYAERIS